MSGWSGRKVRRLVNATLSTKGTVCHLCELPGADSADHDPPRSVLVQLGARDPDALRYLFPAHRVPCNVGRGDRPITAELRAELRALRLAHVTPPAPPAASLSPRFLRAAGRAGRTPPDPSPGTTTKTGDRARNGAGS